MSTDIAALVSDNLDVWTGAIERKSGAGRGRKRVSLYGIEQLRALILDLAVRGKLVPQNVTDEPATELLESIRSERARLRKSGEVGKGKSFPTVSAEPPFDIPENWVWAQISDMGHDWGQTEPASNFTYIDVGSIDQDLGAVRSPSVVAASDAPSRARKIVRRGTVIYSTIRPYLLNIAIIDQEFEPQPIASTAFAVVHPFEGVEAAYLFRYLRSPAFVRYVESCQTGIAYPAINDRQFFAAWCPLPPLAEQRRIVAKVDELMALCDALETQSALALEAHQTLVETLLATLVNATDSADLAHQWARLESHFDALFTTDASIRALKSTAVELAIAGRLTGNRKLEFRESALRELLVFGPKNGFSPRAVEHDTGIKSLSLSATTQGKFDGGFYKFVDIVVPEPESELWIKDGDILIQRANSIEYVGVSALYEGLSNQFIYPDLMIKIRFSNKVDPRFAIICLNSKSVRDYFRLNASGTSGSMPKINHATLLNAMLPVPEIAEQRRIVAKVEELVAHCDAMHACLAEAARTRKYLADAIIQMAAA